MAGNKRAGVVSVSSMPLCLWFAAVAIGALEDALKSDDAGKIRGGIQNLMDASMKLGEAIYKEQAEAASREQQGDQNKPEDEGVVDAEFTDVTDDDRKAS